MVGEVVVGSLFGVKLSCVSDLPEHGRRVIEWRLGCGRWYLSLGRIVQVAESVGEKTPDEVRVMLRMDGVNGGNVFPASARDEIWACMVRETQTGEPKVAVVLCRGDRREVIIMQSHEHVMVLISAIRETVRMAYPPAVPRAMWEWN